MSGLHGVAQTLRLICTVCDAKASLSEDSDSRMAEIHAFVSAHDHETHDTGFPGPHLRAEIIDENDEAGQRR